MRSEAGPEDGSVTGYDNDLGAEGRLKNLSDELLQLCGEIWKSVELCSSSPHSETPAPTNTTGTRSHPGLELETAAAHNQHQMLRSMSPNSDSARETETPVPLDSIRDLKAVALMTGALLLCSGLFLLFPDRFFPSQLSCVRELLMQRSARLRP